MIYEQNFLAKESKIPVVGPSFPLYLSFLLTCQSGNFLFLSGYGSFWGANVPPEFI
jgi:hypothetical protein